MGMGSPQDQPINMTAALAALAPLVNNPRRTVIQAEAITSVVMVVLLLQLIFGSFRRQTSNAVVQAGTWVTYTLSFPAITYTLGMMQSSPVKNAMYPIWAVSLLLAAGCTNAVKVYEIGENKQWKRSLFTYCQLFLYSSLTLNLLSPGRLGWKESFRQIADYYKKDFVPPTNIEDTPSSLIVLLSLCSIIMITAVHGRDFACLFVDNGYFDAKRISKFMKNPPANDDQFNPMSITSYRYPIHVPSDGGVLFRCLHRFTGTVDKAISIDQIWQCKGGLLHSSGSSKDLKDVCLAYSMYQILKCRYHGMACAQEHRPETSDFVLKGLLGGTDADYERVFKIVEVELGFCHDYFFTKYAGIFRLEGMFFFLFVARISLIPVLAHFVWVNTVSVKTLTAIIEVQSRRVDTIITVLVLGIIMLIELLQAAFYLASDWCKVSVACRYYSAGSRYQGNAFFEKLLGYLTRFSLFGHWKNRIDQYSVLSKLKAADKADESTLKDVKLAIVRTLISYDSLHLPTNGEGSLRSYGVSGNFSFALHGRSEAEVMLVWHIATEELNKSPSGNDEEQEFNRRVSVGLSRYCAYLLHSVPELLPGYFGDARISMSAVKEDGSQGSIYKTSEELGKKLMESPDRWKVLADFWTQKILYLAPSDNVKAHMERLANGGEFLTHIWALLTHAGIHKINREEYRSTKSSETA